MKNIFFTDESVKGKVTDSISENLTDLDLESIKIHMTNQSFILLSLRKLNDYFQ